MTTRHHTQATPETQGATLNEAASDLYLAATMAADSIHGILDAIPPTNPHYAMLMALRFVADGLSKAANDYDQAEIESPAEIECLPHTLARLAAYAKQQGITHEQAINRLLGECLAAEGAEA